jgi:hypothetical protein
MHQHITLCFRLPFKVSQGAQSGTRGLTYPGRATDSDRKLQIHITDTESQGSAHQMEDVIERGLMVLTSRGHQPLQSVHNLGLDHTPLLVLGLEMRVWKL